MLALLRSTGCHPSARWVYRHMRETYPELSLGTVYRNLRLLAEEGLIASVGSVRGQERFDGNLAPHAHFICDRCGAVLDTALPGAAEELACAAARETGGRVTGLSVRLHGICGRCLSDMQV